jgi:hypothetical protein
MVRQSKLAIVLHALSHASAQVGAPTIEQLAAHPAAHTNGQSLSLGSLHDPVHHDSQLWKQSSGQEHAFAQSVLHAASATVVQLGGSNVSRNAQ